MKMGDGEDEVKNDQSSMAKWAIPSLSLKTAWALRLRRIRLLRREGACSFSRPQKKWAIVRLAGLTRLCAIFEKQKSEV